MRHTMSPGAVLFLLATALVTVVVSGSYQRGVVARWPLNVIVMPRAYPDVLTAIRDRSRYDNSLLAVRGLAFGTTPDEPSFYISRVPGASVETESLQRFMQSCAFVCYVYADAVQGITIHDALPLLAASQAPIPTHYAVEMDTEKGGAHNCSCLINDGQDRSTWSGIPASSLYGIGYNAARVGTHGVASLYTGGYTDGLVPLTDCSPQGTLWAPAPWATVFYALSFRKVFSVFIVDTDSVLWRWYDRVVQESGVWLSAPDDSIPPTPPDAPNGTRLEWPRWNSPNAVPGSCLCLPGYVGHTCSDHFTECALGRVLPGGAAANVGLLLFYGRTEVVGGGPSPVASGTPYGGVSDWSRLSASQTRGLRCDYGGCKDARGGVRCQLEPCGLPPHGWNVSWCGAGVCAPESGRCLCDPGWDPDTDCSRCLPSHYPDGLGACVTWRGMCVDPQGDEPGSAIRGQIQPPECSGHGTCSLRFGVSTVPGRPPPTGSAACVCNDGWVGRFCQQSTAGTACGLAGTRQCRGLLQRHDVVEASASGCDRRLVSLPTALSRAGFDVGPPAALCTSIGGVLASPLELLAKAPWGPLQGWYRHAEGADASPAELDAALEWTLGMASNGVPDIIGGDVPLRAANSFQTTDVVKDYDHAPTYVHCMVSPCSGPGRDPVTVLVTHLSAIVPVDLSGLALDVVGHVGLNAAVASGAAAACGAFIPGATPTTSSLEVGYVVAAALMWDSQRRRVPIAEAVGVPVAPATWTAARVASVASSTPVSTLTPGDVTHRQWTFAEAFKEAYTDVWIPYFSLNYPATAVVATHTRIAVDAVVIHPETGKVSSFGIDGLHVADWTPRLPHNDVPGVVVRPGRVWTTCSVPDMPLDALYRMSRDMEGVVTFAPRGVQG